MSCVMNVGHGGCREAREDAHADAPRAPAPFLHGHQNRNRAAPLQLSAASQPRLRPSNPGIVDLDLPMQRFARGIDHGPPELVQHHPGRFIASQAQLALEQEGRDAAFVGDGKIGRPKPDGQRRLRVVEDRASRQRHLVPAGHALPARVRPQAVAARVAAARTHEPVRPAARRQVVLTGFLGRELALELAQIPRKRRARHVPTLHVVAC